MEGAFNRLGLEIVERRLEASMREERVRENERTDDDVTEDCVMDDPLL